MSEAFARMREGHLGYRIQSVSEPSAPRLLQECNRLAAALQEDRQRREQAERALAKSEARYRALFEQAPICAALIDFETLQVLTLNEKAREEMGYTSEQIKNLTVYDLEIGFDAEMDVERSKAAREHGIVEFETQVRRADGQTRDLEVCCSLVQLHGRTYIQSTWQDVTEQKRMQEALRQSEEQYRGLVENVLMGMLVMQGEPGRLVYVNQTIADMLDYSREELLAFGAEEIRRHIHPEDRDIIFKRYHKRLHGEDMPSQYQMRMLRRDGSVRWVEMFSSRITYRGQPAVQATYVDITRRKEMERALRESEGKYRALAENTNDIAYSLDINGIVTYIGPQVRRYGLPASEIIGRHFSNFVLPDDLPAVRSDFRRSLGLGEELPSAFRIADEDGEIHWLEEHGRVQHDESGAATGVTGVLRDVTERKQIEEALRESEERYRRIFENSPMGIAEVDPRGIILDANQAHEALGYTRAELCGSHFSILFPGEASEANRALFNELVSGKRDYVQAERRYATKHGREIWGSLNVYSIRSEEGEVERIIAMVEDITERKRMEKALQESEERYRRIFSSSPLAIAELNAEGVIVEANQANQNLLGYPPEELKGVHFSKIFPADVAEHSEPVFGQVVAGERDKIHRERRFLTRDGDEIWGDGYLYAIRDQDGALERIIAMMQDITQRKRAQRELQRSTRLLQEAQRIARVGSWEANLKTGRSHWSAEIFRILGLNPEEVEPSAETLMALISPEDVDAVRGARERAMDMGEPFDSEFRVLRPDGQERVVHVRCQFYHDEDGEPIRSVGTIQDITERRRTEREIRKLSQFRQSVIDTANVWLNVLDENANMMVWNRAAEQISGYRREEVLGHDRIWEWLYPDEQYRERILETARAIITNGETVEDFETRIVRKDGEERIMAWNSRDLLDEDGEIIGSIALGRDITDGKEAEERLQKYQERLRSMAARLSLAEERERRRISRDLHDEVGQLLTAARIRLDAIAENLEEEDKVELLEEVTRLVDESLEFTHSLTYELTSPILYEVGLGAALEQAAETVGKRHDIAVRCRDDGRPKPLAEPVRVAVYRAVKELLHNVVKHARARNVELNVRRRDDTLLVSVQDDGVGCEPERLDNEVTPEGGFGLFDIRERLNYLGGSFRIRSRPGEGTTATLVVPLETQSEQEN